MCVSLVMKNMSAGVTARLIDPFIDGISCITNNRK